MIGRRFIQAGIALAITSGILATIMAMGTSHREPMVTNGNLVIHCDSDFDSACPSDESGNDSAGDEPTADNPTFSYGPSQSPVHPPADPQTDAPASEPAAGPTADAS